MNGKCLQLVLNVTLLLSVQLIMAQSGAKPITDVSQSELSKGVLVDVRTPREFKAGHLEGARNIDWLGEDFNGKIAGLPGNKTIYLYCQKGGRSSRAAQHLDSLGYKVIDLTGGYQAVIDK